MYKKSKPSTDRATPAPQNADGQSALDFHYLCSLLGAGKLVQILLGILMCGCISRGLCYYTCTGTRYTEIGASGQHFVLLVASLCIIFAFLFFLAHFVTWFTVASSERVSDVSWLKFELIYTCVSVLFYFIAFCIEAAYASGHHMHNNYDHSAWIAAAIFCFFNWCLYVVTVVLLCRKLGISFDVVFPRHGDNGAPTEGVAYPHASSPQSASFPQAPAATNHRSPAVMQVGPPAYYHPQTLAPTIDNYRGPKTITV